MKLLDRIEKALHWLEKYDERNDMENIGETIILSIFARHIPITDVAKRILIRSAEGCVISDGVDRAFVAYAKSCANSSPLAYIPLSVPPKASLDTLMKLCLLRPIFDEYQKDQLEITIDNIYGPVRFGLKTEFDYYYLCHYIMALSAFGTEGLHPQDVEEMNKFINIAHHSHGLNKDLVIELYLAQLYLGTVDAQKAISHLENIQLEDGSFDRGSANYKSNLHSTLVALWLMVELVGKGYDNH